MNCEFFVDCGINHASLLIETVLTVCVDYSASLFHALNVCMLVAVHFHVPVSLVAFVALSFN